MELKRNTLKNTEDWGKVSVTLPQYDVEAMVAATKKNPAWVHFGAGNIFRGFIASLQQELLNQGGTDTGIVAVETFDYGVITDIYEPFDNLTMNVTLNPDASTSREIIASIAEGLRADASDAGMMARLKEIFVNPSLQMLSFTITEKGYSLTQVNGDFMPVVASDMEKGPAAPAHAMSMVASLLWERFQNGAAPLAVVSMDNCSHNGAKLQAAVLAIAEAWEKKSFVTAEFVAYLKDESKISFPWSMIDKITPRPATVVQESLEKDGILNMAPVVTAKGTFIAPFVNAEKPQYLVVEDKFPNGRPALEKTSGMFFCERDIVNKAETMKVTTCLNPLHTAMSVYGCMLGYDLICEEMKDPELVALVRQLGYVEGLPVVVNPGIIDPKSFIDEVIESRLPNPFMPDDPRRIATDTSQKVGIRFGETVKSYLREGKDVSSLVAIPLAIAGWFRYLLAVDDKGEAMECSADPMKETLQKELAGITVGTPDSYTGQLKNILTNEILFGLNLVEAGLSDKIEALFVAQLAGPGAVRQTLKENLTK